MAVSNCSLWLVRSHETVDDAAYMRAMIPHHFLAILTSTRAHIRNPQPATRNLRVRDLADGIIEAQVREIGEMRSLITDLEKNSPLKDAEDLSPLTLVGWRGTEGGREQIPAPRAEPCIRRQEGAGSPEPGQPNAWYCGGGADVVPPS